MLSPTRSQRCPPEKPGAGGPTLELEPARRDMTVHDLLRHTAGLTYGFFGPGLVKKAYVDAKIWEDYPSNAEFVERLAKLPFLCQPGTTWDYSHATDVLGRLVRVVSGRPFGEFLKARIFTPLGMPDTAFYVPEASKQGRIVEPFATDRTIGVGAELNDPRVIQKWESGGGGLVSTTMDYYLPGAGFGFGLGFAVRKDAGVSPFPGSVGEYDWGGAAGTYFWVDPKEDLFVVYMMQSPKQRVPYRVLLKDMVYGAVEKAAVK